MRRLPERLPVLATCRVAPADSIELGPVSHDRLEEAIRALPMHQPRIADLRKQTEDAPRESERFVEGACAGFDHGRVALECLVELPERCVEADVHTSEQRRGGVQHDQSGGVPDVDHPPYARPRSAFLEPREMP